MRVVQPSVTEAILARGLPTAGIEQVRRLLAERSPRLLFGHEFCGEVVELGEGVNDLAVGERVAAKSMVPCGVCELCRTGRRDFCRKGDVVGRSLSGAFAEYASYPREVFIRLPDSFSDNEGAALQPLTSCVPTVADGAIGMGDSIAVIGQGVMGLCCLQIARHSGAGLVIGIDVRDQSLQFSAQLGADLVVDARHRDPVRAVMEATNGAGADVVFEAAGGSPAHGLAGTAALSQAIQMVADGGRIVQVAHLGGAVDLPAPELRERGINYVFPKPPMPRHLEHAVRLVATGRVRLAPLVTHTLDGLEKLPEAFERTANKAKYGALGPAQLAVGV